MPFLQPYPRTARKDGGPFKTVYVPVENGGIRLFYELAVKIASVLYITPDEIFLT